MGSDRRDDVLRSHGAAGGHATSDIITFGGNPSVHLDYKSENSCSVDAGEAHRAGRMITGSVTGALNPLVRAIPRPLDRYVRPGEPALPEDPRNHPPAGIGARRSRAHRADGAAADRSRRRQSISRPGMTSSSRQPPAASPVDMSWGMKPTTAGCITGSGLYTAPGSVGQAEVVVVTGVSRHDPPTVGSAMILVSPPVAATGLVVNPANLMLTAGQSFGLLVTDAAGTPADATCSLDPDFRASAPCASTLIPSDRRPEVWKGAQGGGQALVGLLGLNWAIRPGLNPSRPPRGGPTQPLELGTDQHLRLIRTDRSGIVYET
jgi:hypothetical protein